MILNGKTAGESRAGHGAPAGASPVVPPAADRSLRVYQQAVRKAFSFLKGTSRLDDLFARSLSLPEGRGYLVPVCELHAGDETLIALLSRWREENAFAYPTQFKVTRAGTAAWLRGRLLDAEDRLLFLVLDPFGRPVGHLGYANCLNDGGEAEIDNVVRGDKAACPGIMGAAMQAVLDWAVENLGPRIIFLRVFSDNEHAVGFYRRLGFRDDGLIPLRRQEAEGTVSFVPRGEGDTRPPDRQFLRMVYKPAGEWDGRQMILTAGPSISAREASYAIDAARHGWNAKWNDYLKRFEESFAAYVGAKYALATSSCTGALHLALAALGIGPGDEVIVPDITWVATANAVLYVGATPVFADVRAEDWCMDPASAEALITPRTKAIVPVHLYGHPAPMDRLMDIARRRKLSVVEDAAPAIGAEFAGRRVGAFGEFGAFSFQGAKLLVTGEGGMLVTNCEELHRRAYTLWDQGRVPGTFWIQDNGLKYKMSNVQAALGLGQLERVDELIEAKRRIFAWYAEGLEGVKGITLNHECPPARSIYWMTSLLLDEQAGISRDQLAERLKQRNVDTRPVFPAISQYPVWPARQQPQPVARRIGERAMNLPSGVCLRRAQVEYVCRMIREVLGAAKGSA
jgi:perosamine synthetase